MVQEKDFQQHKIIDNGKREGMNGSAEERRGREGYRGRGGGERGTEGEEGERGVQRERGSEKSCFQNSVQSTREQGQQV